MGLAIALKPELRQQPGLLLDYWGQGLWNAPLLAFAVQMMLMLVLGHVMALSPPFQKIIAAISSSVKNGQQAAAFVGLSTMLVGLLNWGLGLIFGAILARSIAQEFQLKGKTLNYPLIGAAGYAGMMVWHGGFSGSAPLKAAESGHLASLMQGKSNLDWPAAISFENTVFSPMNILATGTVLILTTLLLYFLGKRSHSNTALPQLEQVNTELSPTALSGAEKLDHSPWMGRIFGLLLVVLAFRQTHWLDQGFQLGFINPNFINLCLFASAILCHSSFSKFLSAIDQAMGGASGILIQFPLYFGIMGIMKEAGLVSMLSDGFVAISNATSFPILSLFSAGIVNFFVPSGGGQWAVQGPILLQAARELNVPLAKTIMALSYGDQLTNMLQPFWALPLLGITGLKAKDLLPYTALIMVLATLIFCTFLLLF